MARIVTVANGYTNIQLPNGATLSAGQSTTLTDEQFSSLAAGVVGTVLTDGGVPGTAGDQVKTQAANVAAPAALTSAQAGAAPTQAQFNALQTDVVNLRTTVANLLTALTGASKPMHT